MASVTAVVDYFHERISPRFFVALTIMYVLPFGDWIAYVLVPGGIVFLIMSLAKLVNEMIRRGFLRAIWESAKFWLTTAWIKTVLQLHHLSESWGGQVALSFGVVNLGLFAYWVYRNVDIVKFVRGTVTVVRQFFMHLTNPPRVMAAFREWIGTFWGVGVFLEAGKRYTDTIIQRSERGEANAPIVILSVTAAFGLIALAFYYARNLFAYYPAIAAGIHGYGRAMFGYGPSSAVDGPGSGGQDDDDSSSGGGGGGGKRSASAGVPRPERKTRSQSITQ